MTSSPRRLGAVIAGLLAVGAIVMIVMIVVLSMRGDGAPEQPKSLPGAAHARRVPSQASPVLERLSRELAVNEPSTSASPSTSDELEQAVLKVVAQHGDGSPAVGITVSVVAADGRARTGATDTEGRCQFTGLPGGVAEVWSDRLERPVAAELIAGATVLVPVQLHGRVVVGVVRDGIGIGIADASVVYDALYAGRTSSIVAKTAADGSFRIPSLGASGSIWTFAPGFAPSAVVELRSVAGPVHWTLRHRGGVVRGRVVDRRSAAIANAVVMIGQPQLRVASDEHGRFSVDGIAMGVARVCVRARSYAEWESEVSVGDVPAELFVELDRGVHCHGVVRRPDGSPAAGVHVSAAVPGVREVATTTSKPDGSFELMGLPEGRLELVAEAGARGRRAEEVVARLGEDLTWNVVLPEVATLRGRVATRDGRPVAGMHVRVETEVPSSPYGARGKTDSNGAFVFDGVTSPRLTIIVEHAPMGLPVTVGRSIAPSAEDVVLWVDAVAVPSAVITATVRGAHGAPLSAEQLLSAEYYLAGPTITSQLPQRLDEAGGLRCGPLPPATIEIVIVVPGFQVFRSGSRALAANEPWDIGTVQLTQQ